MCHKWSFVNNFAFVTLAWTKNSITFSDKYRDYIKWQYPSISNKNVLIMFSHSSVKHENSVVFHRLSIFRVSFIQRLTLRKNQRISTKCSKIYDTRINPVHSNNSNEGYINSTDARCFDAMRHIVLIISRAHKQCVNLSTIANIWGNTKKSAYIQLHMSNSSFYQTQLNQFVRK